MGVRVHNISQIFQSVTKDANFYNYLLIVDAYSNITTIYGIENITTEEVMDKIEMFQKRFGNVDKFGWWDMDRIQTDAVT